MYFGINSFIITTWSTCMTHSYTDDSQLYLFLTRSSAQTVKPSHIYSASCRMCPSQLVYALLLTNLSCVTPLIIPCLPILCSSNKIKAVYSLVCGKSSGFTVCSMMQTIIYADSKVCRNWHPVHSNSIFISLVYFYHPAHVT